MKEMENPRRLFEADEAPLGLRTWLRQAQQDVPSPAETERLIRSVETCVAAPPTGFRRTRGRGATKVLAGIAVIGVGLGGYMASRSRQPSPTITQVELQTAPPATVTAPLPAPAAPAPTVHEAPALPVIPKAPRITRGHSNGRDTVHHTGVATQPPAAENRQSDEFALLRAARQAIDDRPARALALTEEHARVFPTGMLAQEREAIAIEALVKLGRVAQAQTRAQRFLAAHPDSPYKSRIDAALLRASATPQSP